MPDKYAHLTAEERRVLFEKNTERPFTGEYDQHFEHGVYTCRACGTPLYQSQDKFDAHCGWPSFDQEIPGKVGRRLDAVVFGVLRQFSSVLKG